MKRILILKMATLCAMTMAFVIGSVATPASEKSPARTAAPIVSTTVVISQAYGGGGGSTGTYLNDYVELKNVSSTPQSLNGMSLQYGSALGNFGSGTTLIFALPNVTLAPGQY
ncbi:MAG TPA: hypothetical protein VK468_04495, partial [Pyrinomonadaceae bacterium]|nr:hypothetical protein [Pyrinomonadaceae bacterium]